ncbi:MAG: hypothetical protein OXF95_10515 [Rhodobacteraceae bacterium]|nr:hypothetical protein [Paracoccaceae bacterium]
MNFLILPVPLSSIILSIEVCSGGGMIRLVRTKRPWSWRIQTSLPDGTRIKSIRRISGLISIYRARGNDPFCLWQHFGSTFPYSGQQANPDDTD